MTLSSTQQTHSHSKSNGIQANLGGQVERLTDAVLQAFSDNQHMHVSKTYSVHLGISKTFATLPMDINE